jgi:hypothetical protein
MALASPVHNCSPAGTPEASGKSNTDSTSALYCIAFINSALAIELMQWIDAELSSHAQSKPNIFGS